MENTNAIKDYKELEAVLLKILDDEGYPKIEASKPMDSVEANNLFMRGYMTGFNELYGTVKELRDVLRKAVDVIKTTGCANPCIFCTKNTKKYGRSCCDGFFVWDYQQTAERLLKME